MSKANFELTTILFESGRNPPDKTKITIRLSQYRGMIDVGIKLPEAEHLEDFGPLPVINGTVTLPVRLAFLAYSRQDAPEVLRLRQQLLNKGILPWLDTKDLLGGQRWRNFRNRAIREADHCLLFLSKTSVSRTGEFQAEIKLAVAESQRRPEISNYLIPVKLENCELPDSLSEYNCIDLSKDDAFELLSRSIRSGK